MEQCQELFSVEGHQEHVWSVAWSPNGSLLASCGADKVVTIWVYDNEKLHKRQILDDVHTKTVRSVSFSPDGRFLATGSFDATIGVWIISDGQFKLLQTLEGHENEVKCVAWSFDSKYLASCSRDKSIWVWDYDEDLEFQCNSVLSGHTQDVKYVKWAQQSYTLLSCSYDDTIRMWRKTEEDWESEDYEALKQHESTVWCLDLNQQVMVSVGDDRKVIFWRPVVKDEIQTYSPFQQIENDQSESIYSCSFNCEGRILATGSGDNTICIYSYDDGKDQFTLRSKLEAHIRDVNCVAFHPKDPNLLVSCGDDQLIKLFRLSF